MNSIFTRLAYERSRLGLNQTEFGAIGGVTLNTQNRYETGKRTPDADYLERIAKAGVDVHFILTGERIFPNEQSRVFYEKFLRLEPAKQTLLINLLDQLTT